MLMNLRRVGSGEQQLALDASRLLFRVGGGTKVSELLYAIPMVRGEPVQGVAPSTGGGAFSMKVSVQRISGALPAAGYYDNNNDLTEITSGLATAVDFPVARLGLRFSVPQLDVHATAPHTAADLAEHRTFTAAACILQKLDTDLIQGSGAAQPQNIKGLTALLPTARKVATSGNLEVDVGSIIKNIFPNGSGAGEGIDALLGNAQVLRKLQTTLTGQGGRSGYGPDARTGLPNVYHYMGIPFYRCDVPTVTNLTTLYGVNFGGTGVNLIYTQGTAETFGLSSEVEPIAGSRASQAVSVHGGYALALWEEEAAYGITGIDVTGL